jgi:Zn-dependent protease
MISTRIWGTVVRAKLVFILPLLLTLWAGLSWVGWRWHPGRTLPQALLIGLASTILLAFAEIGHPFAHVVSARYAGAPMDELLITNGMPRTLYWNNAVSPDAHRLRALGGPVFNVLALLISAAVFGISSGHPVVQELAAWSAMGHGLLLIMSLVPVPMVDGGALLKWTMVARGRAPAQADALVQRVDQWIAIVAAILGAILLAVKIWMPGIAVLGISAILVGIVTGRLR